MNTNNIHHMAPYGELYVTTNFGSFLVKKNKFGVSLGGRGKGCTSIANKGTYGYLGWIQTNQGGCELMNKEIRGDNVVKFVNLAITILKEINPTITKITLLDDSSYPCVLPNGSIQKVVMYTANILFHQATYYEQKFGAYIPDTDTYKKYRAQIEDGFNNPSSKPSTFDFHNAELQQILEPIYKQSATWKDFFKAIDTIYDKQKCTVIYPWYKFAYNIIMNNMGIFEHWEFDIKNCPNISYRLQKMDGGRRKTRRTLIKLPQPDLEVDSMRGELYKMSGWKQMLSTITPL
jgi:hypothetical protein